MRDQSFLGAVRDVTGQPTTHDLDGTVSVSFNTPGATIVDAWYDRGRMNIAALRMRCGTVAPYVLSILRIAAAFLFLQFGTAKWFAFPGSIVPGGGTIPLASLVGFGAILEVVGGTLLLIGLFTRPAAFVLAGEMAVAYFISHAPQGFWPVLNQGTLAVLFSFVWLYLCAAGPGPWSVDAVRARGSAGRRER